MDEHLADSDAMDYDMDRADGEWALSDYVQKGIEVLDNDTGFFMMCEGGKIDWACFQPSPGRFPSSADGSGFTHLLLMYMNLDKNSVFILWEGRVSFNQMMKDIKSGKDTDFVDELIFKVINAPTKRMKIEYV